MAMAVSSQQSRDAALLRATTELFVLDKTHDQAEIRRFEELAAHFLTKVSPSDRAFVAERLARHEDAPPAVLRLLGKDLTEIASPVLRHAALSSFDLLAIMAASGPAHWRLIAARPDLAPDIIQALRLTGDAETIALLPPPAEVAAPAPTLAIPRAAEPAAAQPPSEPQVATAEIAADAGPSVDEAPVAAANQSVEPKAAEPLSAFAAARVLTASLSAELTALATEKPVPEGLSRRTFEQLEQAKAAPPAEAAPPAAVEQKPKAPAVEQKPEAPAVAAKPVVPVAAEAVEPKAPAAPAIAAEIATAASSEPKAAAPSASASFLALDRDARLALLKSLSGKPAAVTPRLTPAAVDNAFRAALSRVRLSMLARQRQRDALIATLAEGLRLDAADVKALLDDPSGEALAVLLKAIGLAEAEMQQVLLLANPVMSAAVETFFRLSELFGGLEKPAADRLVGQWRGEEAAEQAATHQPHFADAPRKDARPAAGETATVAASAALRSSLAG
ncbi:hypothetical protein [Kaistia adipata]|uniref:hypothetical protein n=1 Tax=Kaistia adipata TaxID=166954 RepID=UPI0003FE9486|nr:hypothetical protein [Kaistia adipata]